MKHINLPHSRPAAASLNFVFLEFCDRFVDGYCYSLEVEDGALGFRRRGGIAGEDVFTPLLSKG